MRRRRFPITGVELLGWAIGVWCGLAVVFLSLNLFR
jgi:hypothetical protein